MKMGGLKKFFQKRGGKAKWGEGCLEIGDGGGGGYRDTSLQREKILMYLSYASLDVFMI